MRIAVGFDHAGLPLRDEVVSVLEGEGHEVVDLGTHSTEPVDYPDIALAVGRAVAGGAAERGALVCGSGAGVAVAASKIDGVRASTIHDTYTAHQAVEHDDVNVLCLGGGVIGPNMAAEILRAFVGACYNGEPRHARRLAKLLEIERTRGRGAAG